MNPTVRPTFSTSSPPVLVMAKARVSCDPPSGARLKTSRPTNVIGATPRTRGSAVASITTSGATALKAVSCRKMMPFRNWSSDGARPTASRCSADTASISASAPASSPTPYTSAFRQEYARKAAIGIAAIRNWPVCPSTSIGVVPPTATACQIGERQRAQQHDQRDDDADAPAHLPFPGERFAGGRGPGAAARVAGGDRAARRHRRRSCPPARRPCSATGPGSRRSP